MENPDQIDGWRPVVNGGRVNQEEIFEGIVPLSTLPDDVPDLIAETMTKKSATAD